MSPAALADQGVVAICGDTGKRAYATASAAWKVAQRHGGRAKAYRCPHCTQYHVTSGVTGLHRA